LEAYLQEPPPLEIVAVERTYLVPLLTSEGQYLEKPLMAVVDLLTQEGGQLKVHEFKTSGRAFGQAEVETSLQATFYANAVFQTFEELPPIEFTGHRRRIGAHIGIESGPTLVG
jgi:hypothetical protein